jgi:DNA-binding XRE family transcriptional regulator
MSQIVLAVSPEVIRLLTDIKSCLQRLEAEVRDCRVRLGYPVRSVPPVAVAPAEPRAAGPSGSPTRRAPRSVHTAAGKAAALRMQALRDQLRLKSSDLAAKIGISAAMVYNIEKGHNGISVRIDEVMRRLENSR